MYLPFIIFFLNFIASPAAYILHTARFFYIQLGTFCKKNFDFLAVFNRVLQLRINTQNKYNESIIDKLNNSILGIQEQLFLEGNKTAFYNSKITIEI